MEKVIFQQDIPTPTRNATFKNLPPAVDDCSSSETYPGDATVKLSDIYSPMASLDGETPPSGKITRLSIYFLFWHLLEHLLHRYPSS